MAKRPVGRPQKEWDKEQARAVRGMVRYGIPIDDIASIFGMSKTTIYKLYRKEIKEGQAMFKATLTKTAYSMAVDGKNTAMVIFLLKTRCGFKETSSVEVTDKTPSKVVFVDDLRD